MNWRPEPDRWSIALCFEHLIKIQTHYLPTLASLAAGTAEPTLWERVSPFSGLFGRLLIRSLDPGNKRKTRTAAKSEPSSSEIGADVIGRFGAHQAELVTHLRALPSELDPKRVVITSPLAGFVTYTLDDCMTILVVHGRRHFAQAERVSASQNILVAGVK